MIQTQRMDPAVGFHPALSSTQRCLSPTEQRLLQNFPLLGGTSANQIQTLSGGTIIH